MKIELTNNTPDLNYYRLTLEGSLSELQGVIQKVFGDPLSSLVQVDPLVSEV